MGALNLYEYRVDFYFPKCDEAFEILEECPFIWRGKNKKEHFVRKGDIMKYSFNVVFPGDTKEDKPMKELEDSMSVVFKGMSNRLKALDIHNADKIGYELIRVGLKKTIKWKDKPDEEEKNEGEDGANTGKGKKNV